MAVQEREDKLAGARQQGQAQFESIWEMVAVLRQASDDDYYQDTAEELARDAGYTLAEDPDQERMWLWRAKDGCGSDISYGDEDEAWLAACDDNSLRPGEDEAREAISEDPLSVQVRSGWHDPGAEGEAEEFEILLCTGGPACRLIGTLDQGQPSDVRIEVQDWFTPWVDYMPVDQEGKVISGWRDVLLEYARQFYFGD